MLFSSRLSLSHLIDLCQAVRHYTGSGLSLLDVFCQQARRGPSPVRPVAGRIAEALGDGESLGDALDREARYFPPLLLSLARVGEETGMVPEVFHELEEHFRRQRQLRRMFLGLIVWPVIQLVAAIFVLAGLILVLGLIPTATTPSGKPYDPLGLGLKGPEGAAIFLGIVFTLFASAYALYRLARVLLKGPAADRLLLGLPVMGPCLRSLAMSRFCLALGLTSNTGMSIIKAVKLSLAATGNAAFTACAPATKGDLREGNDLTHTLTRTRLFPEEFLRVLSVAEASGRLSEVLQQQGEHYHDESARRMSFLTAFAGYGVWVLIGVCLIVAIFRLFSSYLALLDSVM